MTVEIPGGTYNLLLVISSAPFDGPKAVRAGDLRFGEAGMEIPEVGGGLFGLEGAGSLEVRPRVLQGSVHTSTTGGCGRYGPGFPLLAVDDVVRVVADQPLTLDEGRIVVEVVEESGRVAAALSIVDNGSDDPITVVLEPF